MTGCDSHLPSVAYRDIEFLIRQFMILIPFPQLLSRIFTAQVCNKQTKNSNNYKKINA